MYGLQYKPIIAVDFDGTVVRHEYPDVGGDIGAVPWLKKWVELGARLILFTMRDDQELADAVVWFEEHEIPLWGIQSNPEQLSWTKSIKPYAKLYLDDHGFGVPLIEPENERPYVNWSVVGPAVVKALK